MIKELLQQADEISENCFIGDSTERQGYYINLIKALADEVRGKEWQPIETAPKDGSEFLGFEEGFIPFVVAFQWIDGHTGGFKNTHKWCNPTHWQPLPQPPKEKS